MKRNLFTLLVLLLAFSGVYSQEHRFNAELDKFCRTSIKEFKTIPNERKIILDGIAKEIAGKKYVVFTCKTNSRRTVMLQVWAQTSFYYYGVLGKYAFSIGDTITSIYPGVANVLRESGFFCMNQENVVPNRYVISINQEYPVNMLSSKNEVGTIDTAKGVIVDICFNNEESGVAAHKKHIDLPYQSPTQFENTPEEKEKYRELNHQIALEKLYLAKKTKGILSDLFSDSEY